MNLYSLLAEHSVAVENWLTTELKPCEAIYRYSRLR